MANIAYIKENNRIITVVYEIEDGTFRYGATIYRKEGKKDSWTKKHQRDTAIQRFQNFPVKFKLDKTEEEDKSYRQSSRYHKFVVNLKEQHKKLNDNDVDSLFFVRRNLYKQGVCDRTNAFDSSNQNVQV